MAVLKNRTQKNFTIISNNVLRDPNLSMKDRGVFVQFVACRMGGSLVLLV